MCKRLLRWRPRILMRRMGTGPGLTQCPPPSVHSALYATDRCTLCVLQVRKAVVFCLVDMYMVLGEQLTPRTRRTRTQTRAPRHTHYAPSQNDSNSHPPPFWAFFCPPFADLAVLSTSQLKLVTIYINRTAKARADRTSSPQPAGASPPSLQ